MADEILRIPLTSADAEKMGHELLPDVTLKKMSSAELSEGQHYSALVGVEDAVVWCGPCQPNGMKRCCYADGRCFATPCNYNPGALVLDLQALLASVKDIKSTASVLEKALGDPLKTGKDKKPKKPRKPT